MTKPPITNSAVAPRWHPPTSPRHISIRGDRMSQAPLTYGPRVLVAEPCAEVAQDATCRQTARSG